MGFAHKLSHCLTILFVILITTGYVSAQTPGLIYKPATNGGNKVLDPNGDGYVSKTSAGFPGQNMDEGAEYSEISYKPFPVFMNEPLSDLSTGNGGGHTDFAPKIYDASGKPIGSPLAMYFDGTNFLFRVRLGGQSTASKGYSVLMDTNNDVSGTGINPGFEFEVVLATNFDVRIYDHRTNTTGGDIIFNGSVDQYSQKAIASSMGGGDPDYFYDFYVPMAAFNGGITTTTPLRMTGVTVTSAKSGIYGVASDLGGVNDQQYSGSAPNAWKDVIKSTSPSTPTDINTGGFAPIIAIAPTVSEPILTTSTSISGYSVEAVGSTIKVYQNNVLIGTTTVGTNGLWTLSSFSTPLVANGAITATVKPTDKSESAKSSEARVKSVQSMCKTAPPVITANDGSKGFFITTTVAGTLRIYKYDASSNSWKLDRTFTNTTPGTGTAYSYGSAAKSLPDGSYFATIEPTTANSCESERSNEVCFVSANGNNGDAITDVVPPQITTTSLNLSSTLLQGTTSETGATLLIYKNGAQVYSNTLAAGTTNWSYTLTNLSAGDVFYAKVSRNTSPCGTALSSGRSNVVTVVDTTVPTVSSAPSITGNYCASASAPVTSISGTSTEAPGTTIKLYNGTTLLATTTVNAYGSWTVTGVSIAPGTVITAKATAANKTESPASASVTIGTIYSATSLAITGPATVFEGTTSVSGTAPANSVVTLYINSEPYVNQNGAAITASANGSGAWSINNISPFELYAGARLTITAKANESSTCESAHSAPVTVACNAANTNITATFATPKFCPGTPAIIKLSTSESGVIYNVYRKLANNTYEVYGSSVLGNGSAITLTSAPVTTAGTILLIRTIKVGAPCQYNIGGEMVVDLYPEVPKNFTVTAVPESSSCANVSVTITLQSAETGYTYQLINNGTKEKIGDLIVPTEAENGLDIVFTPVVVSKTTTYGIVIKGVTSGCIAENTILKTITITGGPDVNRAVTVDKNVICLNSAVNISVATENSYTYKIYEESSNTLLETFTGNGSTISKTISGIFGTVGTKRFYVTVSSSSCTNLKLTQTIAVTTTDGFNGTVTAGASKTVCGSSIVILEGSKSEPGTGLWTIKTKPAGAANPTIANPTKNNTQVSGLVSGTYEFTWTVKSACSGEERSSTVSVIVNCPAEVSVKTTKFVDEYRNGDVLATMSDADGEIVKANIIWGTIPAGTSFNTQTGQLSVSNSSMLMAGNYFYRTRTTDAKGFTSDSDAIAIRMYSSESISTPLPFAVEMVSFTALYANQRVNLNWVTASEENNDRFEVERSINGAGFQQIGTVKGNGTTSQTMRYSFTDASVTKGTIYYRLKQLDTDGKYSYSKLVTVTVDNSSIATVQAYPNPFERELNVMLVLENSGDVAIQLLDVQGKAVYQTTSTLEKGLQEVSLPLHMLSKGVYILRVSGAGLSHTLKVIKTN